MMPDFLLECEQDQAVLKRQQEVRQPVHKIQLMPNRYMPWIRPCSETMIRTNRKTTNMPQTVLVLFVCLYDKLTNEADRGALRR